MIGFITFLAFAGFLSYKYYNLQQYSLKLVKELTEIKGILEATSRELQNTITDRDTLTQKLEEEKNRMDEFAAQVAYITRSVELLEKIQATDEELLQKYSRVYFLNENYVPQSLTQIDKEYLYNPDNDQYLHTKATPFLKILMDDAISNGIDIKVISA